MTGDVMWSIGPGTDWLDLLMAATGLVLAFQPLLARMVRRFRRGRPYHWSDPQ